MKKIILFSVLAILVMSCGTTTGNPEVDTIGISVAFGIVAKSWSYWFFIVIAIAAFVYYIYRVNKSGDGWSNDNLLPVAGFFALILFSILFRPCEIAANTSIAAYQRGNIIGY